MAAESLARERLIQRVLTEQDQQTTKDWLDMDRRFIPWVIRVILDYSKTTVHTIEHPAVTHGPDGRSKGTFGPHLSIFQGESLSPIGLIIALNPSHRISRSKSIIAGIGRKLNHL